MLLFFPTQWVYEGTWWTASVPQPCSPAPARGANHQSEAGNPLINRGPVYSHVLLDGGDSLVDHDANALQSTEAFHRRSSDARRAASWECWDLCNAPVFFFFFSSPPRWGQKFAADSERFDGGTLRGSPFLIGRLCSRRNAGWKNKKSLWIF